MKKTAGGKLLLVICMYEYGATNVRDNAGSTDNKPQNARRSDDINVQAPPHITPVVEFYLMLLHTGVLFFRGS